MTTRTVIVKCVILCGLMLATVGLCRVFPNAATDPQTGMLLQLPEDVPGYHVGVIEPSKKELKWLPEDTGIVKRSYLSYDARSRYEAIFATLILSGNDPRSLHRPRVCLDGQGWTITSESVVPLKVNGHPLEVMDFRIERNEEDEAGNVVRVVAHYVYWWIGQDRSTPHDWKRILYTDLDNLFRNVNNRWGYPSVMVQVDPNRENGDQEARLRAYHWIAEFAPTFQKSLLGPASDDPRS